MYFMLNVLLLLLLLFWRLQSAVVQFSDTICKIRSELIFHYHNINLGHFVDTFHRKYFVVAWVNTFGLWCILSPVQLLLLLLYFCCDEKSGGGSYMRLMSRTYQSEHFCDTLTDRLVSFLFKGNGKVSESRWCNVLRPDYIHRTRSGMRASVPHCRSSQNHPQSCCSDHIHH